MSPLLGDDVGSEEVAAGEIDDEGFDGNGRVGSRVRDGTSSVGLGVTVKVGMRVGGSVGVAEGTSVGVPLGAADDNGVGSGLVLGDVLGNSVVKPRGGAMIGFVGSFTQRSTDEIAPSPPRRTVNLTTASKSRATSCTELSPRPTKFTKSPVPSANVTLIRTVSPRLMPITPTDFTTSAGSSNENVNVPPTGASSHAALLLDWMISTLPWLTQFSPTRPGSPWTPIPGPGGEQAALGEPRSVSSPGRDVSNSRGRPSGVYPSGDVALMVRPFRRCHSVLTYLPASTGKPAGSVSKSMRIIEQDRVGTDDGTGLPLGATEGSSVGLNVTEGPSLAKRVGAAVGDMDGALLGELDGVRDGEPDEATVGKPVGSSLGTTVGASLGVTLGSLVGATLGVSLGSILGWFDGNADGNSVGFVDGFCDGFVVGATDGSFVGVVVGCDVGGCEGNTLGKPVGEELGGWLSVGTDDGPADGIVVVGISVGISVGCSDGRILLVG